MKKWFKCKFNEIGEKAVDSMVNLIFSKNETPMHYFDQNPLINAITKSVNSKVTVKQSNTMLLDDNLERYPPVCDLDIIVSEGIFLLVSDGSMAHTKYFSHINKNASSNCSSASSVSSNGNVSTFNESEGTEKYGIGSIRHSMVIDEKKNKVEFETVGPVKPNFLRYKLEVEMNNKTQSSDKKNMQEDFNRVIFDYSFTGKVYNINTDVIISLWCELDFNKYSTTDPEDVIVKKTLQPRKISSVQCPSIYAPKLSPRSQRSSRSSVQGDNTQNGDSPTAQSPVSNLEHIPETNHEKGPPMLRNRNKNKGDLKSDKMTEFSDAETDSESEKDKSPKEKESKGGKKKIFKTAKRTKNNRNKYDSDIDLEELLLGKDEEKNETSTDKTNYSRKLGRAVISVPLILSSFRPEGSFDLHEDIKYLLKYSKQVLAVNLRDIKNKEVSQTNEENKDNNEKGNRKEREKDVYDHYRESRYSIRTCFWLHLLPFNQNEDFKFVRPYVGYPCYGMKNPVDSIGFLLVTVQLTFDVNPSFLPILNNLVPHSHVWTVAKKFEIFHITEVADRLVVFLSNMPIWVTRLLLGGTQIEFNQRYIDDYIRKRLKKAAKSKKANSEQVEAVTEEDSPLYYVTTCELDGVDLLFILPFWFLLYELVVACSLWKMPLVLYLMLILIILYYQVVMNRFTSFGDKISSLKNLQPRGLLGDYVSIGRTKYKSCSLFKDDNSLLYNMDNLSSIRTISNLTCRNDERSSLNTPQSSLNSSRAPSRQSTAELSPAKDLNTSGRSHQNTASNHYSSQPNSNSVPNSSRRSSVNFTEDNTPQSRTKTSPRKVERSKKAKNADKERREDKFNNSLFEHHLYKKFRLINRLGVVAKDSVVSTPFGNYKLNFLGLGEEYPIFSDDLGDFDLKEFVKGVLIFLKYFQQLLGYLCTFLEKVRFSLDTGYYPTTVLTLFLLFLTLVPLSLFLKFVTSFSMRTLRSALFLYILVMCMKPHLKMMIGEVTSFTRRFLKLNLSLNRTKSEKAGFLLGFLKLLPSVLCQFYKNWLLGLPDHREVDHRKICALQTLPSLCRLLPNDYEIDWRSFKKQFKNQYRAFENNSKLSGVDLKVYAKCKSLIERTVLDDYLTNNLPSDLSGD